MTRARISRHACHCSDAKFVFPAVGGHKGNQVVKQETGKNRQGEGPVLTKWPKMADDATRQSQGRGRYGELATRIGTEEGSRQIPSRALGPAPKRFGKVGLLPRSLLTCAVAHGAVLSQFLPPSPFNMPPQHSGSNELFSTALGVNRCDR